jgi:pimeloyl-ACP methyl ester carboxylesterase
VPTLVIHGARDPRTEPGELEELRATLHGGRASRASATPDGVAADRARGAVAAAFVVLPDGGHSPHSERATADEVTRVAREFVAAIQPAARPATR